MLAVAPANLPPRWKELLSPQGLYHGTDLAEEAVAFCRRRYRRPNFSFSQNSMTCVPLQGHFV